MSTESSSAGAAPASAGSVLDAAAALLARPIEGDLALRCSRLEEVYTLLAEALQASARPPADQPPADQPPAEPPPPESLAQPPGEP